MQIWCNHNAYHIWGWHTFLLFSASRTLYFLPGSSIYSNHNRFRRIWNGTISTSLLFVLKIEISMNHTISNIGVLLSLSSDYIMRSHYLLASFFLWMRSRGYYYLLIHRTPEMWHLQLQAFLPPLGMVDQEEDVTPEVNPSIRDKKE